MSRVSSPKPAVASGHHLCPGSGGPQRGSKNHAFLPRVVLKRVCNVSPKYTSPSCLSRYHSSTRMPLTSRPYARITHLMVSPFTCTPPTKEDRLPSGIPSSLAQTAMMGSAWPVPTYREGSGGSGMGLGRGAQREFSPGG